MANRSYLFATDIAPDKILDRGTFYDGVGEWSYHTPALALLLVSGDCKIGVSVLDTSDRRTASGDLRQTPNLYGRGAARTFKLLRIIGRLARQTGDTILEEEVAQALALLDDVRTGVQVLELFELFNLTSNDPDDWQSEAESLRQAALDLGAAVDALPDHPESGARELGAILDGAGTGPLAALTLGAARNDRQRELRALGLGGFARVLFCAPIPRAAFLAQTAEQLRTGVLLPKVAALTPAPPPDWALVVEQTLSRVLEDGTPDRRFAFVLVTRTSRLLGMGKRYSVILDPEIEDARLTAARLLSWQIETDPDLSAIAIRPDGVCALPGTGQAKSLIEGSIDKSLARAIFQPLPSP